MKKKLISALFCMLSTSCLAQIDSTIFKGTLTNKEYNVYLKIDFYHQNIKVPGQEIFGEMAGYFGDYQDGRKWLITDISMITEREVSLSIINDYGSEDLTAEIIVTDDGKYIFKQLKGSTMKVARNRKWLKIPKTLEFVRKYIRHIIKHPY